MKFSKFKQIAIAVITAVVLSSCSGGICAPTVDAVKQLDLAMTSPSEYPSGKDLDMPVIVTNTSSVILQNIVYSIPSYSTKSTLSLNDAPQEVISVRPQSQAKCATLSAGQSCQLMVHITSASVPGSFKVLAHNNVLNAEKSVFVGLVDVPPSTGVGVDGIALLYDNNIEGALPAGNPPYVTELITMVVTSENVGQFNNFSIVDSNGNVIPYDVLTGNSGQGMTDLVPGSVVTLAVKVPTGSSQLVFKPVLKSDNNVIGNGTGANPEVVEVIPPTIKKAILDIMPSLVNLNESSPSQVITVVNTGNATASSVNVKIGNHVVVSNNTCSSLAVGSSCTYTVSFDVTQPIVGTSSSDVSYNNNLDSANVSNTINYRGISPFVGLTLSSNNIGYQFNATTESSSVSSIVTLTNSGEVLPLTLDNWPTITNFSISTNAGTGDDCSNNQVLTPGDSCNILLTYNNPTVSKGIEDLSIGFSYQDIDTSIKIGSTSAVLNYSTIQSVAVLSYDNYAYSLGTIVNNGVSSSQQNIVVTNIGQVAATNVNSSASQTFSIVSNSCGASINSGESCLLTVQFGPVSSSVTAHAESGSILTNYVPYPSSTDVATVSGSFIGNIATAQTAVIEQSFTSSSGFENGTGNTQANPFQVQQNASSPTVTYTLSNTGLVSADQFYVSYNSASILPWSVTNSTCGTQQSPITLTANSGNSCTITFSLNTGTIGANGLDLSNVQMSWTDQDSPSGQTQNLSGMIYANVFARPIIVTSTYPSPIGTLIQKTQVTVTSRLQGGYNVPNQTIVATISNDTNSDMTSSSANCQLSSANSSCNVIFTVTNTPVNESGVVVTLANSTTPAMVPTQSSYTFNVESNPHPFYVAPASPKVGGGFNFSPTFTADQPSRQNPYTVTLPAGITTESGANSYQMTSSPSTQRLNVAPGAAPGLYPITMTDSYGNTFISYMPVSLIKDQLYFAIFGNSPTQGGVGVCSFNSQSVIVTTPPNGSCSSQLGFNGNSTSAVAINSTGTIAYTSGSFSRNLGGKIGVCNISQSGPTIGQFSSCQTVSIPGFTRGSWGIAVNTAQTKLYVANNDWSTIHSIITCDISPSNPIPTNCSTTNLPYSVSRISLNYNNTKLVYNTGQSSGAGNAIGYCNLDLNGAISMCSSTALPSFGISYSTPSYNYQNNKLFVVGNPSRTANSILKTTYDNTTDTIGSSFSSGIDNMVTLGNNGYLTQVSFGPNYGIMVAAMANYNIFWCGVNAITDNISSCQPWTQLGLTQGLNIDSFLYFK